MPRSLSEPPESLRVRESPSPPREGEQPGSARKPPPLPASQAGDAVDPQPRASRWDAARRRQALSFGSSFLVHLLALLTLGLWIDRRLPGGPTGTLLASFDEPLALEDDLERLIPPPTIERGEAVEPHGEMTVASIEAADLGGEGPDDGAEAAFGAGLGESVDPLLQSSAARGGGLDGRGAEARALHAAQRGGSPESERAVERGLRWLQAHQRDDGSWHFDLNRGPCRGACRDPGKESSTTAATAIALLPFLGAGYTHRVGPYQDTVGRGFYHLGRRALMTQHGADLQEGTMYAQGLATIALCEGHAMTGDPNLRELARQALRFVLYAQDVRGGGWRYTPGEPGDTTVTGWQMMALRSGRLAGLDVSSPNWFLAQRFLDSVQSDDGAQYGYMNPSPRETTTAIGLLCRMYGGWGRDHPGLKKGVALLARQGPSKDNMYYNYYATQVLFHWEGPEWDAWNRTMRDHLIATQAREGHESGSWHFSGGHGDVGGRIYNTAMAVMTLEVYYRYMPLYGREAVETDF